MKYKTMILQLLRQRRAFYTRLRGNGTLLPTLDRLAKELKASHEAWMDRLAKARPGSDPSQIAAEALEIALQQQGLSSEPPPKNVSEPLSLDAAMEFLRRHTPPA
jgi:hypothetical protein